MSHLEKAPFPELEEHPWIGYDRGHEFYEVPGHYNLLVRGARKSYGQVTDLELMKQQREALDILDNEYGIRNSGFSPVYAEGGGYVVTDIVNGDTLEHLLERGRRDGVEMADELVSKLIDYSSDLVDKGGVIAGDIYNFDEYMARGSEAVLVDVDVDPIELPSDHKLKLLYLLDAQIGNIAKMAAGLANRAGETPAVKKMIKFLERLDPPTPQMKDMVTILIDSVESGNTKDIIECVYGESKWREYADGFALKR